MMKIIAKIKREQSRAIKETAAEERRILGLPEFPSSRKNPNRSSSSGTFNMKRALVNQSTKSAPGPKM